MKNERSLKQEATKAMKWRGHTPGPWKLSDYWKHPFRCCTKCGMAVYVDANPPANGIDVSGEAVALNCKS